MNIEDILSDDSKTCKEMAELLSVSVATVIRRKKTYGIISKRGSKPGKPKPWQACRIEVLCGNCKNPISIPKSKLKIKKYCSRKCMYSSEEYSKQLKSVDRSYLDEYRRKPKNLNLKEYRRYRNLVARLSEKIYKENIAIINPNKHPRGICGVDGAYQLDHIQSISECFALGISVEEASRLENLQMLPWKVNLLKR